MEGILHVYHPKRNLLLFEHTPQPSPPSTSTTSTPPTATLLFIGGMYDNFLVPRYTAQLAHLFPRHSTQRWAVMHAQLSSAGKSFGSSDLDRDVDEMATCITFIRDTLRRTESHPIVLMGHSTGCQDVLHYLYSPNPPSSRPTVQGAILQAPVSDREAALHALSTSNPPSSFAAALEICHSTPTPQHRDTYIPLSLTRGVYGPAPLSISRFLSLFSPTSPASPGPDDLFSSDLSDSRLSSTFGHVAGAALLQPPPDSNTARSILVLMSAGDAYATPTCSQTVLLGRWRKAMAGTEVGVHGSSAVIAGAVHDVSGEEEERARARADVLRRVLDYLDEAVGGVEPGARRGLRSGIETAQGLDGVGGRDEGVEGLEREVGDVKL